MNYQECLDFLFNQFPQYQSLGGKAFKPGLETISSVCNYLGNPQDDLNIIHVAGTNGKGSTCSMTASILQEARFKVGLFTSPHLIDFTERIRINGQPISKDEVVDFVNEHLSYFKSTNASFFEWSTALAFSHFKKNNVDWVMLETGLGGRLDSTNICNPKLSVITSIGIDHTQYLGNTIEEISMEKGGIIKPEVPVIVSENNPDKVIQLLSDISTNQNSEFIIAKSNSEFESELKGEFQGFNKGNACSIVEYLNKNEDSSIEYSHLLAGFKNVLKNTGLRGRFETLQNKPLTIADIGHNFDGVKANMEALKAIQDSRKIHFVWGMVKDKEINKIIELLPRDAQYYLSAPNIPRAMKAEELSSHFEEHHFQSFKTVKSAYINALQSADEDDILFIGGSTFVVSEIILEFFNQ